MFKFLLVLFVLVFMSILTVGEMVEVLAETPTDFTVALF